MMVQSIPVSAELVLSSLIEQNVVNYKKMHLNIKMKIWFKLLFFCTWSISSQRVAEEPSDESCSDLNSEKEANRTTVFGFASGTWSAL